MYYSLNLFLVFSLQNYVLFEINVFSGNLVRHFEMIFFTKFLFECFPYKNIFLFLGVTVNLTYLINFTMDWIT